MSLRVRLGDLVAQLGGELIGDPLREVARIAAIDSAGEDAITFLANAKFLSKLADCSAGCVIVAPALRDAASRRGATIVTADPYHYHARLTQWWSRKTAPPRAAGIHRSACVESGAEVHATAVIGALAYIGSGAVVGAGAIIEAQAHVGAGARVGEGTVLHARAVLADGCVIGARGIVHSGAVIGADGFGFAPHQGRWEKIEQLGIVRIGDDVEIGANTCIDRGAIDDTVIEDGVKLDNLIQIGHNVHIGAHTAMAGCVGVAGSARIGRNCTIAGGARILGHLELADHVNISVATVITRSIRQPGTYSGIFPFDDNASWEKNAATLKQLHSLRERLRTLEKKP